MLSELDSQDATAVAVNSASVPGNLVEERGDVYVANQTSAAGGPRRCAEFGPDGAPIQTFGAPSLSEGDGIAVDANTGTVYVADAASNKVDVFGLEPAGPPAIDASTAQSLPGNPAAIQHDEARRADQPPRHRNSLLLRIRVGELRGYPLAVHQDVARRHRRRVPAIRARAYELGDLAPGTYRSRVVIESSFGRVESPEHTFTILALVSGLPDGRAWEMVSPPTSTARRSKG